MSTSSITILSAALALLTLVPSIAPATADVVLDLGTTKQTTDVQIAEPGVKIQSPLLGANAKEPAITIFDTKVELKGRLIYAWDNTVYDVGPGTSAFKWPWDSHLVTRIFPRNYDGREDAIHSMSHKVETDTKFLYEPRFSPDGNYVLFKIGDPTSFFGTYQLYLWDLRNQHVRIVTKESLSYRSVYWSNNSRYFAYIQGAEPIPLRGGTTRAHLYVYDVQTGSNRKVQGGEPLADTISWNGDGSLLYCQQPGKEDIETSKDTAESDPWPNIYQVHPGEDNPRLLIRNGYRPLCSPDGQRLIYFSSQKTERVEQANPAEARGQETYPKLVPIYLFTSKIDGSERKVIGQFEAKSYRMIRWAPNSRHIITMERIPNRNNTVSIKVASIDVMAQSTNPPAVGKTALSGVAENTIGTIVYNIRPGLDITEDTSLFRPLEVSRNGKYLFFELLQVEKSPNNGLFLKAIDLSNGSVFTLCRINSVRGLDWHDELTE